MNELKTTGIARRAYLLLKSAETLLERADALEDYLNQGGTYEKSLIKLKQEISRKHYEVAELATRIPSDLKLKVLKREL